MRKAAEVRFSFSCREERELHIQYAKAKGLTLSALAKMALLQYEAKYPLRHSELQEAVVRYVNTLESAVTVQSHASQGQFPAGLR